MATKVQPVVIQFESEEYYRAVVELVLFGVGLKVDKFAQNLVETKELVKQIEAGKLKPDLAIIDSQIENSHGEGIQIAAKLRTLNPKIKIIAYTIMDDQDWGDYLAIKSNRDPQRTLIKGLETLIGLDLKTGEIDRA